MRQAPGETKFGTQTKKLKSITIFHSLITFLNSFKVEAG